MSEYQYYEFQAIDRPLTAAEMAKLRAASSRATITPAGFTNHYNWGDFKGNPSAWMDKYFDAFLYLANWGTRELRLRLPRRTLDPATAAPYCPGEAAAARAAGEHVVLEYLSEEEAPDWDEIWDDGTGGLARLLPLRAEIAAGDLRPLYLGWLLAVQDGELGDDDTEPPLPAGLAALSPAQQAMADFLRIDDDLIAAAAERSPAVDAAARQRDLRSWIATLPAADKDAYLLRLAADGEAGLGGELLARFRAEQPAPPTGPAPRRVAELSAAAERLAAGRRRLEAERAARQRARREREAAAKRQRHLDALAGREAETWDEAGRLIATKLPKDYDRAIALLTDLRDLAARDGATAAFEARMAALGRDHARKWSLVKRLQEAGLLRPEAVDG